MDQLKVLEMRIYYYNYYYHLYTYFFIYKGMQTKRYWNYV